LIGEVKPPVKGGRSLKSRSQAPGWITFGADYIKAKFRTEEYRFWAKINKGIIYKFINIL